MPWAKLDDGFWSHPKIDGASLSAVGVYARALSYCAHHRTNGEITAEAALYMARGKRALVRELVTHELWRENGNGYVIPDFLDFNISREEDDKRREKEAERKRKWRESRGD